jgi:hypothetical protein
VAARQAVISLADRMSKRSGNWPCRGQVAGLGSNQQKLVAMNPDTDSPVVVADQETEICISCMQTNPPGTHFCAHCGTPLTSYAATAPLEHAYAFGNFAAKALRPGRWRRPVRMAVMAWVFLLLAAVVLGMILP